ncbi:MAG: sigma-70 family RNA polymerase sigma factor [Candidatus Eremiobacteraeota bacterium]|nr:sigma-70 family RNA polymerase sigma factor [Candidatus Eremiobacteraeota bacterium]
MSHKDSPTTPTFDEIYQEQARYVYNLALRMAGNPADADDIYQEVFLRVHRFLNTYRGDGLKTWLRRITVNVFCTQIRKQQRETPEEEVGSELSTVEGEPGTLLDAQELGEKLAAALNSLGTVMRAAMILRGVEGLSYQEIADLLEIPVGTVRSRLSRARLQLLSRLAGPA